MLSAALVPCERLSAHRFKCKGLQSEALHCAGVLAPEAGVLLLPEDSLSVSQALVRLLCKRFRVFHPTGFSPLSCRYGSLKAVRQVAVKSGESIFPDIVNFPLIRLLSGTLLLSVLTPLRTGLKMRQISLRSQLSAGTATIVGASAIAMTPVSQAISMCRTSRRPPLPRSSLPPWRTPSWLQVIRTSVGITWGYSGKLPR